MRAFEGDFAPVPCLADAAAVKCTECDEMETCGIRLVMADVKQAVSAVLDKTTIADMLERSELERQKLMKMPDYAI